MKVFAIALLLPIFSFATTSPSPRRDYPKPTKLRDITAKATIYKYKFISNENGSWTEREKVCDVQGTVGVFDTHGNTEGVQFPAMGLVGTCDSVNEKEPVQITVKGHMYDGWNSVPWKQAGKSVMTGVFVKTIKTGVEAAQYSEAGTSDVGARSVITTTAVGNDYSSGKPFEYFGAITEYLDSAK